MLPDGSIKSEFDNNQKHVTEAADFLLLLARIVPPEEQNVVDVLGGVSWRVCLCSHETEW